MSGVSAIGAGGSGSDLQSAQDSLLIASGNAGAVMILAANPNRKMAIVTCLTGSAATARIGDSNVDTDVGTPVAAGETIGLPMKGDIWVCGQGNTTGVAINEILD